MVPLSELCISCKCTVCKIYSKLQTRKFSRLFCSHDKTHLLSISLGRSRLVTGGGHYRESPPPRAAYPSYCCICHMNFFLNVLKLRNEIKIQHTNVTVIPVFCKWIHHRAWGVDVGILGGGMPPGSPNHDRIWDQKMSFFHTCFQTWPF